MLNDVESNTYRDSPNDRLKSGGRHEISSLPYLQLDSMTRGKELLTVIHANEPWTWRAEPIRATDVDTIVDSEATCQNYLSISI